jgi:hypothetical protein
MVNLHCRLSNRATLPDDRFRSLSSRAKMVLPDEKLFHRNMHGRNIVTVG